MPWIAGDVSASETLTQPDHLYESHINQLRESNPPSIVIARTPNAQYYCDGTSDEVQIQSAVNTLGAAGGGEIHLKKGTYDIRATISILVNNIRLVGEGWTSILRLANAINDHIIEIGDGGT